MRNLRELGGYSGDGNPPVSGAPAPSMRRMPAPHAENEFFRFDFRRALEMHRRLAAGILALAALATLGYMAKRWNTYKAQALVYVQPAPPRLMDNSPAQQWPYDANTYESYIQQQIHDVTRPDVLEGAVAKLPGWKGGSESDQAAADRLNSAVEVARVGSGYQISITATASSAAEAAKMANAVSSSYIESATRELRAGDAERIELLIEERDRIAKELTSDRTEQEDLNKKLGVAAVASTPDPYDDQIAAVRSELVRARTASDEAASRLTAEAGGGLSSAALDAEADQIVSGDPGLVSMKTELNKRRSALISQMSNLTPSHPQYKQDADELAKINSSLDQMSKDLRAKASAQLEQRLKNDLERTEGVESKLNAQLGQLTGAAGTATPRLQRANDLAADINRLQARFSVVDEQYRNKSMENNAPGAVYLSAAALPPLHAARKTVFRNALILLLTGIIFALGAALIAYNLDPRVYIAADMERILGFAPMAQLPDLSEVAAGVAEEYMLRLAAAVEHAHQQGALNSCIFTGVAEGAGASTVSRRVSGMLQAMGRETVFVDAVGAPTQRHDGALSPGSELVHSPRGSRSTALLQQMTQEASEESVVISDTAPLLVSGETEYLARFVDAVIVVVHSGVTTRAQLREVANTLRRLDVSAVGFVLNRIPLAKADPSFRQSVYAVETRVRVQARAFERPDRAERPDRIDRADRPVAKIETTPEKALESPSDSAGLGRFRALAEKIAHDLEPATHPSVVHEPQAPVATAEIPHPPSAEQVRAAQIAPELPASQQPIAMMTEAPEKGEKPAGTSERTSGAEAQNSSLPPATGLKSRPDAFVTGTPIVSATTAGVGLRSDAFVTRTPFVSATAAGVKSGPDASLPTASSFSATSKAERPEEEPAYLSYLHPAPTAAVEAAAAQAVTSEREFEEPAFIAYEAAAESALHTELVPVEEPEPPRQITAPDQISYVAPEPLTWPSYAAREPEPPAQPDLPDYILKAFSPTDSGMRSYVRSADEPETPKAEPVKPEPQNPEPQMPFPISQDQSRFEFHDPSLWKPEAAVAEPIAAQPEPQRPEPVATKPKQVQMDDSMMETLPPSTVWSPPAESRPKEISSVAHPMRGRETVRPSGKEARPTAPPPAEVVIAPAPQSWPVPTPQRDWSISVMPPVPAAQPREPQPAPIPEPPVMAAVTQHAAAPVEAPRSFPPAQRPIDQRLMEEETLFPFPQRPLEIPITPSNPAPHLLSSGRETPSPTSGPGDASDDLPYSAASRLGGLRNLLVSLGVRNLHREPEFRQAEIESDSERNPERAVYAQPANGAEGAPEPETVVAPPEIIPPRIPTEQGERPREQVRPVKPPRVSRWDTPDDVEILPSRRGQYRRR